MGSGFFSQDNPDPIEQAPAGPGPGNVVVQEPTGVDGATASFFGRGASPELQAFEQDAKQYAEEAAASASAADTSADQAEAYKVEAAAQALAADNSADSALASQNAASTSATNAASSATSASASASNAATSASGSSTSATNAAASASAAAGSATSASTSATNAANSASAAAGSATDAASSASAASTSATNAASSATSASGSAATATTKASEAATSATNAASSATAAAGSASSASGSATSASGSASSASTSATNAANSATAASNSASAASTSATNAASAQTAAESARDATLAAFDSFDDRYLGPKTSNPTVDNDGNALVAGALYFNSTVGDMRVYTGTVWTAAYVSGSGVLLQANNLSDLASVATARTNLGLATVAATGAYADLSGKPTNVSSFTNDSGYLTSFTEADPTVPSHVKAITATNITNWNAAYGWGNHASAGYLTGSAIGSTVQGYDADLGAIAALSGTTGLLKKTAANTWTLDTSTYLTGITSGQVTTALGYTPYSDAGGTISGNVGIGTSSPGYKLDISGSGDVTRLTSSTTSSGMLMADSGGTIRVGTRSGAAIFDTGGSERMRIDSSGQVGVGGAPFAKFDVIGADGNAVYMRTLASTQTGAQINLKTNYSSSVPVYGFFYNGNTGLGNPAFQTATIITAGAERMRIDSSGNVGIGTSSPGVKFQIQQDQAAYSYFDYYNVTNGGGIVWRQIVRNIANTGTTSVDFAKLIGGGFAINNNDTNAANFTAFNIGSSERMRIDSAGNVGIGTSSPSTFGKLAVASSDDSNTIVAKSDTGLIRMKGYQTSSSSGVLEATNPTQSAYIPMFVNGSTLLLGTGGAERMRIDSAGNVGIGTSSPGVKLEVRGVTYVTNGTNYVVLSDADGSIELTKSAGDAYIDFKTALAEDYDCRVAQVSNGLAFSTGGNGTAAERMRIDSAGNVGIGTSNPKGKLQVNGGDIVTDATRGILTNLYYEGGWKYVGNGYGAYIAPDTAGYGILTIGQAPNNTGGAGAAATPVERMRIDSAGNVGIGTSSPSNLLEVRKDQDADTIVKVVNAAAAANATARYDLATYTANSYMILALKDNVASPYGQLSTGSAVTGIYYDCAQHVFRSQSGTTWFSILGSSGTLTSLPTYNNTATGSTVVVTSAGLIRRTSSSIKYKKDVENLDPAIATNAIDNLRPVWYRTKNAEGDDKATWSHIGLIAEEVDKVEPRLVRYRTDEVIDEQKPVLDEAGEPVLDEDGNETFTIEQVVRELAVPEPEDVDYARLSVLLLAEVKSLRERIAALEAK